MLSTAFLPGALHLWEVVENKPANSLVVSLGKALNGTPRLYVEDRWPRHLGNGNSQASADIPSKILRYNSLSREWRINMNTKKNLYKYLLCMPCPLSLQSSFVLLYAVNLYRWLLCIDVNKVFPKIAC